MQLNPRRSRAPDSQAKPRFARFAVQRLERIFSRAKRSIAFVSPANDSAVSGSIDASHAARTVLQRDDKGVLQTARTAILDRRPLPHRL